MINTSTSLDRALQYHEAIPLRIGHYLNSRGIPDAIIGRYMLGWNGKRITIPVFDRDGNVLFFRFARDPQDNRPGPKILSPAGASAELYGWEQLGTQPERIIICEGEFDRLVLEGQGFPAVTSTGGAGVFRPEWAEHFKAIPEVYICFDRDEAGHRGAIRVGGLVPHAKIVELSEEVGYGGDVTDFFVRLGRTREDFLTLLEESAPAPQPEVEPRVPTRSLDSASNEEVSRLKANVALEDLARQYVKLRKSGQNYIALCPFHTERTPSLVIFPQTQTFYCFGCQAHGDIISFIMRIEHISFPEALSMLRHLVPFYEPSAQGGSK
jgi:hypothetical protein